MELLADGLGVALRGVAGVVADHEQVLGLHVSHELLALHLHGAALAAKLHDAAVYLVGGGHEGLEVVEDRRDVGERDVVVELERGETKQRVVECLARGLQRRDELRGARHELGHATKLVRAAAHVEVHDLAALGDGYDEGLREQAHARSRAVAHARLARGKARVWVEVEVGAQDLREVTVHNDGAVHLGELEQAVRRERDVEWEAVVAGREHGVGVAHADEGAEVAGDDHVEGTAHGGAGGRDGDGLLEALLDRWLLLGVGVLGGGVVPGGTRVGLGLHGAPSVCLRSGCGLPRLPARRPLVFIKVYALCPPGPAGARNREHNRHDGGGRGASGRGQGGRHAETHPGAHI